MNASLLQLPRVPPDSSPRPRRAALRAAVAVAVLGAALAYGVHASSADARAVRRLAPEARAALYADTLRNLELCRTGARRELWSFCEDQARLALAFPQCDADGACAEAVRAALRSPTR